MATEAGLPVYCGTKKVGYTEVDDDGTVWITITDQDFIDRVDAGFRVSYSIGHG